MVNTCRNRRNRLKVKKSGSKVLASKASISIPASRDFRVVRECLGTLSAGRQRRGQQLVPEENADQERRTEERTNN